MYTWYCLLGLAPVTSDKAKKTAERVREEREREPYRRKQGGNWR